MLQTQLLDQIKELVFEKYKNGNQHRLEHILGVVEMSKILANKYNIDENDAMIAAYMHDYCKYDKYDDIKKLLSQEEIEECEKYPFLYHAYGSAYEYKKIPGYKEDIFNAIYNHVFGRVGMSRLEEIIMIADYTEYNRKYNDCIVCRDILLNQSIEEAIVYSLSATIKHVESNNEIAHPRQIKVLEEYRSKIK